MEIRPILLSSRLRKDPPDERDYRFSSVPDKNRMVKSAAALPSKFSWRDGMSPVKYQGELGSCVAFAAAGLKEWQEKKEHENEIDAGKDHRKGADYNFSEQWIYWNCKKIDPWPGEEGTNFRSAMKVLSKIGVPTEEAWPYSDDPVNIGEPSRWAHLIARWATIDSYWRAGDTAEEMKRALVEGPLLLGMTCFEEMYGKLIDGKIPDPAKPNEIWGYHAVLAVGFDDATRTICMKNSWSEYWGQEGYGFLSYDYIDNHCWDSWAAQDMSVTEEMLKEARNLIE